MQVAATTRNPDRTRRSVVALLVLVALVGSACGNTASSSAGPSAGSPPVATRPSSTGKLSILTPKDGAVVRGSTIQIRLRLLGARVVRPAPPNLRPDEGHIHVILDGAIVSMNYGLHDVIHGAATGSHLLQVEFVANDHAPFDPRVVAVSSFEVKR